MDVQHQELTICKCSRAKQQDLAFKLYIKGQGIRIKDVRPCVY